MSDAPYQRWICDACGYIYDEAVGDLDSGLAPGTRYNDIPEDWLCPLCGLAKSDLRLLPDVQITETQSKVVGTKATTTCRGGDDYIVIVGAGIAGWSVAEAIRQQNSETPVLLVTACEGFSYPKPALSTAFAQHKTADDLADQDAASKAQSMNIDLRTQTRILKIDTKKKRLTTVKGAINYNKLVLAFGAKQRKLPIDGDAKETILSVNDLSSYRKLRQRLNDNIKHITILGAGLIGCEFAEDLTTAGYKVAVVDPLDYPLSSLVPGAMASGLKQALEHRGVEWKMNTKMMALKKSGDHLEAVLSSGETCQTDLVLSAAGLVVDTTLAEKAGLKTDQGILTDRLMRTSDNDVYAIGDCASVEGTIFAYIEPIRRQAETIAAHLNGNEKRFDIHPPLIRVKTPSFPLTICLPSGQKNHNGIAHKQTSEDRLDYLLDDNVVGFVLSGSEASHGAALYREMMG